MQLATLPHANDDGLHYALPLPEDGLLQLKDVLQFIKVGKSTWWNWVHKGIAPKPKKVGSMTLWRASDIRLFIAECE